MNNNNNNNNNDNNNNSNNDTDNDYDTDTDNDNDNDNIDDKRHQKGKSQLNDVFIQNHQTKRGEVLSRFIEKISGCREPNAHCVIILSKDTYSQIRQQAIHR